MPHFDYGCYDCKNVIEVFHGANEEPIVACEMCNQPMKKLFNVAPAMRMANYSGGKWIGDSSAVVKSMKVKKKKYF